VLGRKLGLTVRATEGTLRALRDPPPEEQWAFLHAGVPLRLGGLLERPAPAFAPPAAPSSAGAPGSVVEALFRTASLPAPAKVVPLRPAPAAAQLWVTPIALPHDAAAPVAYRFEERTAQGSVHAAIVTDLGAVPRGVIDALQGLDLLVLEFNHDLRMLLEGPYPWPLKQRIRGGRGHLSNAQAAGLLARLCHPGLQQVVLAHLSEHNNTPTLARDAAEAVLTRARSGARLQIGSVQGALAPITVEPSPAAARPRWKPAQLALL
jgi:hypothetical protein